MEETTASLHSCLMLRHGGSALLSSGWLGRVRLTMWVGKMIRCVFRHYKVMCTDMVA